MKNKRKQYLGVAMIVLWTCFIWSNSLEPSIESAQKSGTILRWIETIVGKTDCLWLNEFVIRKTAHMFEFFVLGLLWIYFLNLKGMAYNFRNIKSVETAVLCIGTAAIDEGIQLYVPGRSGEIRDVFVDLCGAVLGIVLYYLVLKRKKNRCN